MLNSPTFIKTAIHNIMKDGRLRSFSAVYTASSVTIPIGISKIMRNGTSNPTNSPFSSLATSKITINQTSGNDIMFTNSSGDQPINQSLIYVFYIFIKTSDLLMVFRCCGYLEYQLDVFVSIYVFSISRTQHYEQSKCCSTRVCRFICLCFYLGNNDNSYQSEKAANLKN